MPQEWVFSTRLDCHLSLPFSFFPWEASSPVKHNKIVVKHHSQVLWNAEKNVYKYSKCWVIDVERNPPFVSLLKFCGRSLKVDCSNLKSPSWIELKKCDLRCVLIERNSRVSVVCRTFTFYGSLRGKIFSALCHQSQIFTLAFTRTIAITAENNTTDLYNR